MTTDPTDSPAPGASFAERVMALQVRAHLDPGYDRVMSAADMAFALVKGGRALTATRHYIVPLIRRSEVAAIAAEADAKLAAVRKAAQGLRVAGQALYNRHNADTMAAWRAAIATFDRETAK